MQRTTELYISSVLDRKIINPKGQVIGKRWDVAIAPGDALPIVTGLLLKQGKRVYTVPWQRVLLFNPLVVSVAGTTTDYPAYEATSSSILLRREI